MFVMLGDEADAEQGRGHFIVENGVVSTNHDPVHEGQECRREALRRAFGRGAETKTAAERPASMSAYYTDREYGARPQTIDTIDERLWAGLYSLILTRIVRLVLRGTGRGG